MRPNITAKTTLSIARQRTPPAIQDNISDPTKKLLILVTQLRNYLCIHVRILHIYKRDTTGAGATHYKSV